MLLPLILSLLLTKHPAKPGVDRWPIKTSVHSQGKPIPVKLSELLALGDIPGVTHTDGRKNGRYHDRIIPSELKTASGQSLSDGDLVQTQGWMHLVAAETDGDYHIQISDSPASGDPCLIVEVPNPDPDFEMDPKLQPLFEQVRAFVRDELLHGKEPSTGGTILHQPVYVTVTGQLFYDVAHVGEARSRGKKHMRAANLWEIHPIVKMGLAKPPSEEVAAPAPP